MWELSNGTPFATERTWARDKNGAEVWLIAVKGTFHIKPDGSTQLAEEQLPVCRVPIFCGDPGNSSVLYEADLVQTKLRTDIVVNGHAYAPQGRPTRELDVTLTAPHINKRLRVFGDRVWQDSFLGIRMTDPAPFVTMPVLYERAFGGVDVASENPKNRGWERRNPVGRGYATRKQHVVGKPVANIEDPAALIGDWNDTPRPAGFTVIARHWSPRVELAGTYDDEWDRRRRPLVAADFDDRYFQTVPEDQQAPQYFAGGEEVELTNMSRHGTLRFEIPRVRLGFSTTFRGGDVQHHRAALHTVVIEPDQLRVILVWHTHLACHPKVLKLVNTDVFIKRAPFAAPKSMATR